MMRGFTLIEIMLSISLLAVLAGLTAPITIKEFQRTSLQTAQSGIEQALLTAQTRAANGYLADDWGIEITSTSTVLFRGNTYVSRDSSFDLSWDIPTSVTPTGTTSYIFNHTEVSPTTNGTSTVISTNGDTLWVSVSADGLITLQ